MELDAFDALPADQARTLVTVWADVGWWVDSLVDARPYADVAALRSAADHLARQWTGADVAHALSAHPRIGEPPAGPSAHAAASRREQSGAADVDAGTAAALRAGNVAYEQRFGRVFLIRAAGRSASEVLAELWRRLTLDDAAEAVEVADQLREIALLRLEGTVQDSRAAAGTVSA